jgi:dihydropyrimidinase
LWDPEKHVHYGVNEAHMRTDYNLYEDWELVGMPVVVLLRGEPIVKDGQWLGKRGSGKFIHRNASNPVL